MDKFLLYLLFFLSLSVNAQNTTAVVFAQEHTQTVIQIDSTDVARAVFSPNFKKKYTDPEFIYEFKAPEKNAWDRFKEWLAGLFKNLFNFTSDESAMNLVGIVLKVIAVLIVVGVIYLIVKVVMNKDGRWIFGKSSDGKIIRYEEVEKYLHRADFEKLIGDAIAAGEKRLCIRYYYLWLLKRMTDKQLIEWDIEKTNSDYHYEIKKPALREKFAYLSYLYDYIWYGEFELDKATFLKTKATFESALKSVGNE